MMIFLFACRMAASPKQENETATDTVDETGSVSSPTADSFPNDIDDDGYGEDEDCDNWDPAVYPGAEEIFDHIDNNCDGIVDYDGQFSGVASMGAAAIYEGVSYPFSQQCHAEVVRERGLMTLYISCTIDQTQTNANLLLGQTILIEAQTNTLHAQEWSDEVLIRSEGGEMEWDTYGGSRDMRW